MSAVAVLDRAPSAAEDEFDGVIETAILRFLNGESDGYDVLSALYGAPIDEPIPERMLALVRSQAC